VPPALVTRLLPGTAAGGAAPVSAAAGDLVLLARGEDDAPITPTRAPESVSDEDSFKGLATWGEVLRHAGLLAAGLLGRLDEAWHRHKVWPHGLRLAVRVAKSAGAHGGGGDSGSGGWNSQRHTKTMPLPVTVAPPGGPDTPAWAAARQASLLKVAAPALRDLIAASSSAPSFASSARGAGAAALLEAEGPRSRDPLPLPITLLSLAATGMQPVSTPVARSATLSPGGSVGIRAARGRLPASGDGGRGTSGELDDDAVVVVE
jgi:hypothetical protein